jgi:hypothetical protein
MRVAHDPTLAEREASGEAHGIQTTWDGAEWQYSVGSCWFSVDPALHGPSLCWTIIHEVGHFVHPGPGHTGPMAPETLGTASWNFCLTYENGVKPEAAPPMPQHEEQKPEPITKRQRDYREAKHKFYHDRSNPHPDRQTLAQKWHKLANQGTA